MPRTVTITLIAQLQRSLAFFQVLEEALRIYVGLAEELIAAAVPYGVHLRPNPKALDTASLGRLAQLFRKYNRNDELLARISQLLQHRNHIAHSAFRRAMQGRFDSSIDLQAELDYVLPVAAEAEAVLLLVGEEIKALRT
jgi:hypothetical protein